jgi:hypothetical protein
MAKTLSKLDMIKSGVPPAIVPAQQSEGLTTLQFRIPEHVKRQYMAMAVARQRTMTELFLEASRSIGIEIKDAEIVDRRKAR